MLRMDGFDFRMARSPEEAVRLFHESGEAVYVAGGTDLLPNLKHRILRPRRLVGLGAALPVGIAEDGDHIVIGAGTKLAALAAAPPLGPLARAASLVAGPQIRNAATLGGNVLLDTRCMYVNQSASWRRALGGCLKADGDWCHVTAGPRTCVATRSGDLPPVLLALDASVRLLGRDGQRELPLRDLYRFDGKDHLTVLPGEVLTEVVLPPFPEGFRGRYDKVRLREAIDFPLLGVAIAGRFTGTGAGAVVSGLRVVVGAASPQPRAARGLDAWEGRPLDDDAVDAIAAEVVRQTRPVASVAGDVAWRRHMAGVLVRRGLRALR